jgi:hypothetical protein
MLGMIARVSGEREDLLVSGDIGFWAMTAGVA